jgi:hypothetical protein
LAMIGEEQLRREPERRSNRAPRRRDQHSARLFKIGRAFLRAERIDAHSVKSNQTNRCGFKRDASDIGRALRYAGAPRPTSTARC